jgi:plastocyanin
VAKRKRTKEPASVFWIFIILILGLFVVSVMFFTRGQDFETADTDSTLSTLSESGDRASRVYTVTYKNGVFSPTNLRIHMGDTVRFKNDALLSIHIMSDSLPGFDSIGTVPRGGVFSYTFSSRGIFQYYNERNPDEAGTVIVR